MRALESQFKTQLACILPQFVLALVCPVRNGSPHWTDWSNNSNFGFLVSFYDTIPPFKAGFWKFHIPKFFGNWCRKYFSKFAKNYQIWAENGKKNFGKTGISKSSLEAVRYHKNSLQNQNRGYGTYQCREFFLTSWFSSHFSTIFPFKWLKIPKKVPCSSPHYSTAGENFSVL